MAAYGPVERAVRAEIRSLKFSVQEAGDAALCVALAQQIDGARGAVAAAQASAQVHAILADLRVRARERPAAIDPVDEIAEKRRKRRAGG